MFLTKESVNQLKALLKAVSVVKIEKIIIEEGQARGIDETQSVVLISDTNLPDIGDLRVGLNRLQILNNRIALISEKSPDDFTVEAVPAPNSTDIIAFKLNAKGSKFEFRTSRPDQIKAPKKINDDFVWAVNVPSEEVKVLVSADNTMDSEQVAIVSKGSGEVFFEIVDGSTQDTFMSKFADEATYIGDDDDAPNSSFVFYYSSKVLIPLLKSVASSAEKIPLTIGVDGMLQVENGGHIFTILPKEGE